MQRKVYKHFRIQCDPSPKNVSDPCLIFAKTLMEFLTMEISQSRTISR